jgi:colicin import membrane protein
MHRDVATTGKLAAPGHIGCRELVDQSPQDEIREQEEKRLRALGVLGARKDELTKEMGDRSRDREPISSDEEEMRLKREVEELERMRAAKQRLDDRDDARREKDQKFRAAYVDPPKERHESESTRKRKSEAQEAKEAKRSESMRQLQAQRDAKAQRQKEKEAEGKARQAKAEKRTQKK